MVTRRRATALGLALLAGTALVREAAMAEDFVRAPLEPPAVTAGRVTAWLDDHDTRTRKPLWGVPPRVAAEPILDALDAPRVAGDRMALIATAADAFRVREASEPLLRHAQAPHEGLDGYLARVHALRGVGAVAVSPAAAPAAARRLLLALVEEPAAADALPELLAALVVFAPDLDLAALDARAPRAMAALDAQGRADDGARLRARGVEDFALNDIPRARLAIGLMEEIRAMPPGPVPLGRLAAIHVGEDMRFRDHLAPFAVRMLQEAALAGRAAEVSDAFMGAFARAEGAGEAERGVRRAIAAQAAAWFGARLDGAAAEAAAALAPPDAGLFGSRLAPAPLQ